MEQSIQTIGVMQNIGIIGCTGRMGKILHQKIHQHPHFCNGVGYCKSTSHEVSLAQVFAENDCVIDFSQPDLLPEVLHNALENPKPLIVCTTGWSWKTHEDLLRQVEAKVPLVVASNTSVGAYLQRHLAKIAARILGVDYDIDLVEQHHRHKIDTPSGTALSLIHDVQEIKQKCWGENYQAGPLTHGPRPENFIGISVQRSGTIPADHELCFTSTDERISIKHTAFNRDIFAVGALRIAEWLQNTRPKAGRYTMAGVMDEFLGLNH